MSTFTRWSGPATVALALGLVLALACSSTEAAPLQASFDFEDLPYTVGLLAGQEVWLTPGYSNTTHGQGDVSTNTPLWGSQSLYYLRAEESEPGFFDANDVGRPDVVTAVADGSALRELTLTYLTKGLPNGLGGDARGGPYLGQDTVVGYSPIFVQLNDTDIQVLVSDEKGSNEGQDWATFGSYTPGEVLEFKVEVDFDDFVFTVGVRNDTLGETEFTALLNDYTDPGSPSEFFPFADEFSDDGDGVSYTVDLGVALRDGQIWFDDVQLTAIPEPSTLVLLACALVCLGLIRRKFR